MEELDESRKGSGMVLAAYAVAFLRFTAVTKICVTAITVPVSVTIIVSELCNGSRFDVIAVVGADALFKPCLGTSRRFHKSPSSVGVTDGGNRFLIGKN